MATQEEIIASFLVDLARYGVTEAYLISGNSQIFITDAVKDHIYEMILAIDQPVVFDDIFTEETSEYQYGYGYGYGSGTVGLETYFDVFSYAGYNLGYGDVTFQTNNNGTYGYGYGYEKNMVRKPKYGYNANPFLYIPRDQLWNYMATPNDPYLEGNRVRNRVFYSSAKINNRVGNIINLIYNILMKFAKGSYD